MEDGLLRDIMQWDVRSWSPALRYWEQNVDWSGVGKALELGGREGGLSLWLAQKGIHTVCSDYGDVRSTAIPLHSRYPVADFIAYENISALDIPYREHFDLIVFKSIIGGIGRKDNPSIGQKVFDEIKKALKPGGVLLFAENMAASALHKKTRELFTEWKDYWHYVTIDEMKQYLAAYSSHRIEFTGVLGTFGRNERQKDLLAKADHLFLNKVCPDAWKYICYGMAVK